MNKTKVEKIFPKYLCNTNSRELADKIKQVLLSPSYIRDTYPHQNLFFFKEKLNKKSQTYKTFGKAIYYLFESLRSDLDSIASKEIVGEYYSTALFDLVSPYSGKIDNLEELLAKELYILSNNTHDFEDKWRDESNKMVVLISDYCRVEKPISEESTYYQQWYQLSSDHLYSTSALIAFGDNLIEVKPVINNWWETENEGIFNGGLTLKYLLKNSNFTQQELDVYCKELNPNLAQEIKKINGSLSMEKER